MNNFFTKLFSQQAKDKIPSKVKENLIDKFPSVINVEWNTVEENFEAIFYFDQVEHIALFSKEGNLIEYKLTLNHDELPEKLSTILNAKGKIMNLVKIVKGSSTFIESIILDDNDKRYLLLSTTEGDEIEFRAL